MVELPKIGRPEFGNPQHIEKVREYAEKVEEKKIPLWEVSLRATVVVRAKTEEEARDQGFTDAMYGDCLDIVNVRELGKKEAEAYDN